MRIHPNIQTRGAVCYRTANRYPKPTNVSSAGSPVFESVQISTKLRWQMRTENIGFETRTI
jgi:hypothetical protein